MSQVLPSILDAIGSTPLIELSRLCRNHDGRVLAKLEYLNPGHSKKDRIALQIIREAKEMGNLSPGQAVVELTSGNTGTGLAMVCQVLGHPFVAVMSRGNSEERGRMMEALGAEVVLVDQCSSSTPGKVSGEDLREVEKVAQEIVMKRGAFRADQFCHPGNAHAHELFTGPEIIEQTGGDFHAFCDFAETGGSFAGCTAAFKAHNSNIQCYLVEPEHAAVLSGKKVENPNHPIQGGGYAMGDLKMLEGQQPDGYLQVSDDEAIEMTRRLAEEEGIFAGFSSGANVAAALQLLESHLKGKTIVALICDSGLKYLSTDLWRST